MGDEQQRTRPHEHGAGRDAERPATDPRLRRPARGTAGIPTDPATGAGGVAAGPAAAGAEPLDVAAVLRLQRSVGNQGVAELLRGTRRSPVLDVVGRGGGRPLDAGVLQPMEQAFGQSFSDVRVHDDPRAAASATAVGAHAYTVGSEIVFGSGGFDPASAAGRRMLAHELTHVVQQRQGAVAGTAAPGGISVSDPGDRFEREAEAVASRIADVRATPPPVEGLAVSAPVDAAATVGGGPGSAPDGRADEAAAASMAEFLANVDHVARWEEFPVRWLDEAAARAREIGRLPRGAAADGDELASFREVRRDHDLGRLRRVLLDTAVYVVEALDRLDGDDPEWMPLQGLGRMTMGASELAQDLTTRPREQGAVLADMAAWRTRAAEIAAALGAQPRIGSTGSGAASSGWQDRVAIPLATAQARLERGDTGGAHRGYLQIVAELERFRAGLPERDPIGARVASLLAGVRSTADALAVRARDVAPPDLAGRIAEAHRVAVALGERLRARRAAAVEAAGPPTG